MIYLTKTMQDGRRFKFEIITQKELDAYLSATSHYGTICALGVAVESEALKKYLTGENLSDIARGYGSEPHKTHDLIGYFERKLDVFKEKGIFEAVHQLEEHIDFLKLRVSGRGA